VQLLVPVLLILALPQLLMLLAQIMQSHKIDGYKWQELKQKSKHNIKCLL